MNSTLDPKILQQFGKQAATPVNPRRNGKIARLPKETRDVLNRMLDDGLPYPVIIDELGVAGDGLNTQKITNWFQGGYQDYLKNQDDIARAKAQMEFATDLLREVPDLDPMVIHRACNMVAGSQLFPALLEYGDDALKNLLKKHPERYLTMLNTVATTANASVKLEQHHHKQQLFAALNPAGASSSQIKPNQAKSRSEQKISTPCSKSAFAAKSPVFDILELIS